MEKPEIRDKLAAIIAQPDHKIDLTEAALLIAAENDEDLDVDYYLRVIQELADRFEADSEAGTDHGVSITALVQFIHEKEKFSGNVRNYYDPGNSYLNRVIETRTGIPISLALIHIGIGQRLNLPVGGINFPGHFLVRYGIEPRIIIDPFSGRPLSDSDCATLLHQIAGRRVRLEAGHFEFAARKDILIRMLDNLKQIFWREKIWTEAQSCIERQLLMRPDTPEFQVQLGAVYEMKGDSELAQGTYINILNECEDDKLKDLVSKRLLAMTPRSPTIH